jgi:Spy/CpxP family protein refolding chaperone
MEFAKAALHLPCCRVSRPGESGGTLLFLAIAKEVVMRTVVAVVVLVAGMSAYAAFATADDEKADQKTGGGLAERMQDLNLTDEQEAKIADIRKECKPKVEEAAKELKAIVKEEVDKVREALTEEQRTKLSAAKEERREGGGKRLAARIAHLEELDLTEGEEAKIADIHKEFHPRVVKAMDGLKGLLNEDQKKAREEGLKTGKKRREVIASLNLTDEQKEKVEAVGKEVRALVRDELEKMQDVLTEGQMEKVTELKDERKESVRDRMACKIANLKDLDLTEEQKTKIADIRKEYRPKVHEAGNKLRATIREEVDQIVAVLKG